MNVLKLRKMVILSLAVGIFVTTHVGFADPQQKKNYHKKTNNKHQLLTGIHMDGYLRNYIFSRNFNRPGISNQYAYSLGGRLNLITDPLYGFSLGATLFTAQPLGLKNNKLVQNDRSLPSTPVTVLGQAYLQFKNDFFLGKFGDQLITTPWANEGDTRMIPEAYEGIYTKLTPIEHVDLTAMRLFRFKGRISDSFSKTTVYNPINLATPIPAIDDHNTEGALAFGSQYTNKSFNAQAWGYEFYDYARLAYADVKYTFENNKLVKPIIGAQIAQEWGDGNHLVENVGLGRVDASAVGVLVGAKIADGQITVGYNDVPKHQGAFNNGGIVSPYTSGYTADPLYTTSMIAGLIEKGAGTAVKVAGNYLFFNGRLLTAASYANYHTVPFVANTEEEDFDITYYPKDITKNLSIRDRVGILNGVRTTGRLIYNRVQITYNFKLF